jgi:hypothetical protein
LQAACYRRQRGACRHARALAHSPREVSRVGARMRWQLVLSPLQKKSLYSQLHYISAPISRNTPPPPARSSKEAPREPRRGASRARHLQQAIGTWCFLFLFCIFFCARTLLPTALASVPFGFILAPVISRRVTHRR